MRELKFRAWNGKGRRMTKSWDLFHLIANGYSWGASARRKPTDSDFEGAVVMQYTGLKDKNGKEIYEGDILSPVEVLHGEGNQVVSYCAEGGYSGFVTSGGLQFDECDKIIGNIYENPELLEGK